jgi:hypothetical protein
MPPRLKTRLDIEVLEDRLVPTMLPGFGLPDLNPNTSTSGQKIGPATFSGHVSAYYFMDPG